MPNYEYECTKCTHRFEIWQSVGEAPPPCPECASEVKKVFHVPRVIFKGSGFYVTDLRAEKGKSSGNGQNSGGESKSESAEKPAPATETKSSDNKSESKGSEAKAETSSSTPAPSSPPAK